MSAPLLWDHSRATVALFYVLGGLDAGISGNKLAALGERADGQLWERVAESAVVADVNVIEAIGGTVIRRVQLAEVPHEHVPGRECPNCGHLALRQFWVDSSRPWPVDDLAHRALVRP